MLLASIDPGLNGCGAAIWDCVEHPAGARLILAEYVRLLPGVPMGSSMRHWMCTHKIETLAIEVPQVYTRRKSKGDPNDLINLALLVGEISGGLGEITGVRNTTTLYRPAQWKGQVPKVSADGTNIIEHRITKRLHLAEIGCVAIPRALSLAHNVWDAIGIGLHHLEVTGVRR